MEVSIVSKAAFADDIPLARLDAEFVQPSLLLEEKALVRQSGSRLREIATPYSGPTINDSYSDEDALISYIEIDSVDTEDGLTYSDELLFIDRPSRAKYELQIGDLLISNVRPNRNAVSLVTKRLAGSLASSGFTLAKIDEEAGVSPEFLFAFLKTPYGRHQLIRRDRGSMYPAVLERDVLDLWVPTPPDALARGVKQGIRDGLALHDEFFQKHAQQAALIDELLVDYGSPPSPLDTRREGVDWTRIAKSDCLGMGSPLRIDAEFWRSEYQNFDSKVQELGDSFLLGEYFSLNPGRGLGSGDELVPHVKQAVLTNVGVNWSAIDEGIGSSANPTGRVHQEDILLACTAHEIYYVGRKVDFVRTVPPEIRSSNVAVADIMIIRPRENKPDELSGSYVAAFLRHPAGLHQVQRCIRGLRGGHVYREDLSRYVRIPVPAPEWLQGFEEVAASAERLRNQAKLELAGVFLEVSKWAESLIEP